MQNQDNRPVTAEELMAYDDEMEQAQVREQGEYTPIPDGSYQVEITRAWLARTQTEGDPMLRVELNVLGPTHEGNKLFKNYLFRPKSLPFVKSDFHTMGFPIQTASEIPSLLDRMIGLKLNVKKTTKNDFENIYLNSRIAEQDGRSSAGAAGSTAARKF